MKTKYVLFGIFLLLAVAYAEMTELNEGMCELARSIKNLLPPLIFLLIITAAIVYAAGQLLSAEMRSRASVWATSMIVGAVIAVIILLVVPIVLKSFAGDVLDLDQCDVFA